MIKCTVCSAILPRGTGICPLCHPAPRTGNGHPAQTRTQELYELKPQEDTLPAETEGGAVYTLETATQCPYCQERVLSLRVIRMKRTHVTFTSTLPRGGRLVVCPACDGILSADLTTL
jgi:RNA polymerase subunit RPABC4/transcription elongation factor Spt4